MVIYLERRECDCRNVSTGRDATCHKQYIRVPLVCHWSVGHY